MNDKCNCSMRIKLVGYGCSICNPELAEQIRSDQLKEVGFEWREEIQEEIVFLIHLPHDTDITWDILAEYFTHE